jgi:hypothetical protein
MNWSKAAVFSVSFLLAIALGYMLLSGKSSINFGRAVEVDWRLLGDLDYVTGKATSELEALDGAYVRVPGFMVPLEDDMKSVKEFLLVPTPQACIHVPPPPPNQMVLITMEKNSQVDVQFGPIWVYGKLNLKSKRHLYGETSFTMDGDMIEAYR